MNVEARCEGGVVKLTNFVVPTLWHELRTEKWGEGKKEVKVEKAFTKEGWKGEDWWMTCVGFSPVFGSELFMS